MNKTDLPPAANSVWLAYTAMRQTKQQHLDYLRLLEEKYEKYGQPNQLEENELNLRLQTHDRQVALFRATLDHLKQQDHEAYQAFIRYLTEENNAAVTPK